LAFLRGVFVAAAIYWTGWVLLAPSLARRSTISSSTYIGYIAIGIPVVFISLFVIRLLIVRRRKR